MLPSLFTTLNPMHGFHVLFAVYVYLLPLLLYAAWTSLALMDMATAGRARAGWIGAVLLLPLLGGAAYLLTSATTLSRGARVAIVVAGLLTWFAALAYALPIVWGPLGPKAL